MNKAIKGLFVGVLMMISSVNASREIESIRFGYGTRTITVSDDATWADFKEKYTENMMSLTPKDIHVTYEFDEDEEPDKEGSFEAVDNERIPQHVGVVVVKTIRRQ